MNATFIPRQEEQLDNLSYFFIKCFDEYHKFEATSKIIDAMFRKFHGDPLCIVVFCNKRQTVQWLKWMFVMNCYSVSAIDGTMSKDERLGSLRKIRTGEKKILISTNLMSRGINIPFTKLVINFDMPLNEAGDCDTKSFLHRVGRAGRFGQKGAAVTLITNNEVDIVTALANLYNREVKDKV
ncbi:DEAD-box helicase Dbp80-like [Sitodiplosis mosellana]|uniref:DEAD-box helicase Dbp80-like n=1 Tax=Sitodiplosis mosellana TaxID=263140 RepID=UPI002444649E|nr:DEAD-box helicase Dbp80-like [Sitodiplosis mosellana]